MSDHTENTDAPNEFPRADLKRRGVMLALSSPSGAGKTTITKKILARDPMIDVSTSATTRQKRPGEIDGKDYYFMDEDEFKDMIDNDGFLEHAEVFGRYYGTPRKPVDDALAAGRDVLFDIDWQGTRQLNDKAQEDLVSIFILPPSWEELERRLHSRGQDSKEEIAKRMAKAQAEISHYDEYHYVIINYDIEESTKQVQAILEAERLKRRRMAALPEFVSSIKPQT